MGHQVVWCVEEQFAPERSSVREAREFVVRALARHGLTYVLDDVQLVVSELVTNAIVHARSPVRVMVEELPFCLKVSVYDRSAELPATRLSEQVDGDAEGGRGLWVTNACSTDWGVEPGRGGDKHVWAIFAVRPASTWQH